jgi:hypothetical protein
MKARGLKTYTQAFAWNSRFSIGEGLTLAIQFGFVEVARVDGYLRTD